MAMIDITNAGSRAVILVNGDDRVSVGTPMASLLGSAQIAVLKSVGGVTGEFATNQRITSAADTTEPLDVTDVSEIVLEVATADSSGQEILVNAYSELLSVSSPVDPASGGGDLPQSQTFTYNGDGTIDTITKGSVVTTFTYNGDGTIDTISDGTSTQTFAYNGDGSIASITVT